MLDNCFPCFRIISYIHFEQKKNRKVHHSNSEFKKMKFVTIVVLDKNCFYIIKMNNFLTQKTIHHSHLLNKTNEMTIEKWIFHNSVTNLLEILCRMKEGNLIILFIITLYFFLSNKHGKNLRIFLTFSHFFIMNFSFFKPTKQIQLFHFS